MKNLQNGMDERLDSPAQQAVRNAVKALPEDSLSLAWRSGLNEQLLQVAEKRRRRARTWFFLRPAAGLAATCALVGVFMLRSVSPTSVPEPRQNGDLGSALVSFHRDASLSMDVSGTSLNPIEATNDKSKPSATSSDWSESDVENL